MIKIKFSLYSIPNQNFVGDCITTWTRHVFWRGDWSPRLHLIVPFPLFSTSSTLLNSSPTTAATSSPRISLRVEFATRERSHAPTISSHNAKSPSCQRSAVNHRQVSCNESRWEAHVANPSISQRALVGAPLEFLIVTPIEGSKLPDKEVAASTTHMSCR
jgi:hypothetical protein